MKSIQYALNLLSLWINHKIGFQTVRIPMVERPMAVFGKGGSYHVDPVDPNVSLKKGQSK